MPTTTLLRMLAHPAALDAFDSLSKGASPQGVLAGLAGDLFAKEVAKALGAVEVVRPGQSKSVPKAAKAKRVEDADIIDAEYTVINVSPGVKRRTTKEK
jgi:hypothetical protein